MIVSGTSGGSVTLDMFTKPSIHHHPHHAAYHDHTATAASTSDSVIECLDVDVKLPSLLLQLNDESTRWLLLWATSLSPLPPPSIPSPTAAFGGDRSAKTTAGGSHPPFYTPNRHGSSSSSSSSHPSSSSMSSSVTLTQWEQEMHFDVSTKPFWTSLDLTLTAPYCNPDLGFDFGLALSFCRPRMHP